MGWERSGEKAQRETCWSSSFYLSLSGSYRREQEGNKGRRPTMVSPQRGSTAFNCEEDPVGLRLDRPWIRRAVVQKVLGNVFQLAPGDFALQNDLLNKLIKSQCTACLSGLYGAAVWWLRPNRLEG